MDRPEELCLVDHGLLGDQKQAEHCKILSKNLTNISISDPKEVMEYAVKLADDTKLGDQLICKGCADVQKDVGR